MNDAMRQIQKAIDAKATEIKGLEATFQAVREQLDGQPVEVLSDPESEQMKAAEEAHQPLLVAQNDIAKLNKAFQRHALMEGDSTTELADEGERGQLDALKDLFHSDSIGAQAIAADTYKSLRESGALADGSEQSIGRVSLHRSTRDEYLRSLRGGAPSAALLTGQTASGAALLTQQVDNTVWPLPYVELGIDNLITIGATDAESVRYVRQVSRTLNATEVPEASTTGDIGVGGVTAEQAGLKPESGLTFERVESHVKTIAHTLPLTRQEARDAAGLQTTIDVEMRRGVEDRRQRQIIAGDGVDENLLGILNMGGLTSYTQGTADPDEPRADAHRRIITKLKLLGFNPNAHGLHPEDWEEVRLAKDGNGNYIFGPPSQVGTPQMWGLPVVETPGIPKGSPLTAEWARFEYLVREGVQMLITDSHKDWFARNLLLLLAEASGLVRCRYPQAFGEVTYL